jgi:hypothetical protein
MLFESSSLVAAVINRAAAALSRFATGTLKK